MNPNYDTWIEEYVRRKRYRQINSVLLWQNGEFLAKCYFHDFDENSRNEIKSVGKSIISVAAGIMIDRNITLRHLLTMSSGLYWIGGVHYHCPMLDEMFRTDDWMGYIADITVKDVPGTKYVYKEWDIILLTEVLNHVSGDIYAFINDNLYQPLGIQSAGWFQTAASTYYTNGTNDKNEKRSDLTAMEMFKIGQMFLQDGIYQDKQIVSKEYIKMAISPSPANPGYGFMWWRGEGWYGCRGYGGQSITVVPKKKLIMVTQAAPTARGMGYDDFIWDTIDMVQ